MHVQLFSSRINSSLVTLSQHRHLIRHSLTRKLINYHTAVLCRTAHSQTVCFHAAMLFERHLIAWHLSPARCIWPATRQCRSAAVMPNSTGFIKQGNTGSSQLAFLNGDFHQASLICCFASSHPFHSSA